MINKPSIYNVNKSPNFNIVFLTEYWIDWEGGKSLNKLYPRKNVTITW